MICSHFGWTYDYLLNGIAWSMVQRMMVDAPRYDSNSAAKGNENHDVNMTLSEDNAEDVINYVNSMM